MTLTYFFELLKDVLINTLSITMLVMIMLLLVEFVNISSSGKWMEKLKNKPFLQIVIAALMGLIPGCFGGFAVVSLYTHRMISFGALLAGMISCFGDEAFVMFAISPQWTLLIALLLTVIGVIAGSIVHFVFKKKERLELHDHTFELHHGDCTPGDHQHNHSHSVFSIKNIKRVSFPKALLLFGLLFYMFCLITGVFAHNHFLAETAELGSHEHQYEITEHQHSEDCDHTAAYEEHEKECNHGHDHSHDHGFFSWENILFFSLALITFCIVALSSEHFLTTHLWEHVIKKHFLTIFLWTFGVLLCLQFLFYFVDIKAIIENNQWTLLVILFLALIIGLIPESGPHLIFVVMFFSGTIPFSILLANSIVQNGHSPLPLIAESRKSFFLMKGICLIVGLLVGLAGYFIGF